MAASGARSDGCGEDGNQQPSTFLCCNMPNSFDAAAALSKESIL